MLFDLDLDEFQQLTGQDPGYVDVNFEQWKNANVYIEFKVDDAMFHRVATDIFNHLRTPSIRHKLQRAINYFQRIMKGEAEADVFKGLSQEEREMLSQQFKLESVVQFCMSAEEFAALCRAIIDSYGETTLLERRRKWSELYIGYNLGDVHDFYEQTQNLGEADAEQMMLRLLNCRDVSALPADLQREVPKLTAPLRQAFQGYFAKNYSSLLPLYNAHKHGYRVALSKVKRKGTSIDGFFYPKTEMSRGKRMITGYVTAFITDRYQDELMQETDCLERWFQILMHFFEHGFNQESVNWVAATMKSQSIIPQRGSAEALLPYAGSWFFAPGELECLLSDIEQMREMELEQWQPS